MRIRGRVDWVNSHKSTDGPVALKAYRCDGGDAIPPLLPVAFMALGLMFDDALLRSFESRGLLHFQAPGGDIANF